jgi:hypothetical protein
VFLGLGCDVAPDPRPTTWPYLHAAIVVPSCASASCHSSTVHAGGLVLQDATAAQLELVGEQYVLPGDPHSPLMFLLEGNERDRMPPDAPLPRADIELIRRWVVDGAAP